MRRLILAILVLIIQTTSSTVLADDHEEREKKQAEIRCYILNSFVKKERGLIAEGVDIGTLYSKIFDFASMSRVGQVEVSRETNERVKKVELAYEKLKRNEFRGSAATTALNTAFFEMHNINLGVLHEANRNFPECKMLEDKSQTATSNTAASEQTKTNNKVSNSVR